MTTTDDTTHPPRSPEVDLGAMLAMHDHVVFVCDDGGHFTYLSPGWERLTGHPLPEALGCHFSTYVPECEIPRLYALLDAIPPGGVARMDSRFTRADGHLRTIQIAILRDVDDNGWVHSASGTLTDVTDRYRDELQVRHGQKMEAVGRLAAGIAHEINTPIQFIGDNVTFLADSFDRVVTLLDRYRAALDGTDGNRSWAERQEMLRAAEARSDIEFVTEEVPEAARAALEGTTRVAAIVRAMKAFGHPTHNEPQPVDLDSLVRNTLIVARNEIKYVADVDEDLGAVPLIPGDPSDLGQVVLNLLVNAADAVRDRVETEGGRGRITVRTRADRAGVQLSVTDTGAGMPVEVADHVFEPFFTTKEVGKGTGQGLPLARSVMEAHSGSIWFETGPEGTTFHLRFPLPGHHEFEAGR